MVPVGTRVLALLHHYIEMVRPRHLKGKANDFVFVAHHTGEPLKVYAVRWAIQEALRKSGLPPIKTCSLRGTAATHLLHAGMRALPISKLLGHQSLRTTLYYLRISLRKLTRELASERFRRRMERSIRGKNQGEHESTRTSRNAAEPSEPSRPTNTTPRSSCSSWNGTTRECAL